MHSRITRCVSLQDASERELVVPPWTRRAHKRSGLDDLINVTLPSCSTVIT